MCTRDTFSVQTEFYVDDCSIVVAMYYRMWHMLSVSLEERAAKR